MRCDDDPTGDVVSAAAIAGGVRSGAISAVDAIEQRLDRIATFNPQLNALVAQRADEARAEARTLDDNHLHNAGPMSGVAFTAKDVLATADLPTTAGSRLLRDRRYKYDAAIVARMRLAGGVLVGKSNCPEFAFGVDTTNDLFGRTNNPLGPFTVGGSSGGEAAAVASGMSVIGLGTDFGGSVRWPAQCTGLYGLRPTIGRFPGDGQIPGFGGIEPVVVNPDSFQGRVQVPGILAASVDSIEHALTVLADAGVDTSTAPRSFSSAARPVPLPSMEVAFGVLSDPHTESEPCDAVAYAAELLGRAGAALHPGLPGAMDHAPELYSHLREQETLAEIIELSCGRTAELTTFIRELIFETQQRPRQQDADSWAQRDRLRVELLDWLRGARLLIMPVATVAPFDIHASQTDPGRPQGQLNLLTPCRAVSLFGIPALSVPIGRTRQGRPLSVQLVGAPYREDVILAAARHIEASKEPGWTT